MSLIGQPRKGFNVMAYNKQKADRIAKQKGNRDIAWAAEQCAILAESGQRPDDGDPFNAGWNNCCKDIATNIRDFAREYDK